MLTNCHYSKNAVEQISVEKKVVQPLSNAIAPILIYKTRKDYSIYVPVLMNAEKTKIVSYPDPSDIYFEKKMAYPTPLEKGYLLDNRGIGPNVAFLNYTYEAYSQLKESPTMEVLMSKLLDKAPLLEMWNCGARTSFSGELNELNVLIEKGFPNCTPLIKEPKVFLRP